MFTEQPHIILNFIILLYYYWYKAPPPEIVEVWGPLFPSSHLSRLPRLLVVVGPKGQPSVIEAHTLDIAATGRPLGSPFVFVHGVTEGIHAVADQPGLQIHRLSTLEYSTGTFTRACEGNTLPPESLLYAHVCGFECSFTK